MSDSKEKQETIKKPRMEPYKRQHVDWHALLLEEEETLEEEYNERE